MMVMRVRRLLLLELEGSATAAGCASGCMASRISDPRATGQRAPVEEGAVEGLGRHQQSDVLAHVIECGKGEAGIREAARVCGHHVVADLANDREANRAVFLNDERNE